MMRSFYLLASLSLTLSIPALAADRFVQDRFAIGLWVDPPLGPDLDARYAELAEANFTFTIANSNPMKRPDIERLLAICEKHNLRAIVTTAGLPPEQSPDSPACWGYSIVDEPSAAAFPDLRKKVDAIRAARPGKLAYINLFPNYANASQLGTPTYDEHVSRFMSQVQPDVLSMDHYPIFLPSGDGRDSYCQNLEAMRKAAGAAKIPFWNFFNTMPYGPHSDPTEAQLRWQIYTSLAYGAKGLMYFCYWTPRGGEFPKGGAIIAVDGRRTRHYDEAKRINAALVKLGPTLMKLESVDVRRVTSKELSGKKTAEVLKGSPLKDLTGDAWGEYLVGSFRHADGRRAVMVVNYHFAYAAWPTLEFDAPMASVVEVDPATGREIPVRDESPDMSGTQTPLDAGQGRLFLLPK